MLALLVFLIAFYWEFLIGSKQFFIRDLGNFFEPLCRFMSTSIQTGHFPLWNKYAYCGMPEIAVGSPSILYPPTLIFCILPFGTALAFFLIFSHLICALGAFLLVESLGWGAAAAILFASAISLCGYMFSLTGNFTIVATASWVPLLMWGIRNTANTDGPSFWKTFCIAVPVFMLLSAGRPEIWLPALLLSAVFVLYLSYFETPAGKRFVRFFFLLRALLLGILLSLPAILPALEWAPLSRRSGGLSSSEILMFSASWYDFLCSFASLPLGDLQLRMASFQPLVDPHSLGRFLGSSFVSSFVFALSFFGLERGPTRKYSTGMICALICTVTFAILSSAGNLPFADSLIKLIPGASLLRFPSKLLFFVSFGLALLAARGLRNYLQHTVHFRWHLVFWCLALLGWTILLLQNSIVLPFTAAAIQNPTLAIAAQKLIALHSLVWTALACCLLIIMWVLQRSNKKEAAAYIACASCAIALYSSAFQYYRHGAAPDYFTQPSVLANKLKEYAKADGKFLRYAPVYLQGFTIPPQFRGEEQLSSTIRSGQYSREMLNGFSNIDFGIPSIYGYEGAMKGDYFFFFMNVYGTSSQYLPTSNDSNFSGDDIPLARFLQICASRYAITQRFREVSLTPKIDSENSKNIRLETPTLDPRFFKLKFEDEKLNARIYETSDALPYAYLSYSWTIHPDNDEILNQLLNSRQNHFDPNLRSLLEASDSDPVVTVRCAEPVPVLNGRNSNIEAVAMMEDGQMIAEAHGPCILVLAEQYYPGWKAWVDNTETKIYRCNGFMRAILLKPGKHHIRFTYEPDSFKNGLLLALISILWMLVLLISDRKKRPSEAKDSI